METYGTKDQFTHRNEYLVFGSLLCYNGMPIRYQLRIEFWFILKWQHEKKNNNNIHIKKRNDLHQFCSVLFYSATGIVRQPQNFFVFFNKHEIDNTFNEGILKCDKKQNKRMKRKLWSFGNRQLTSISKIKKSNHRTV